LPVSQTADCSASLTAPFFQAFGYDDCASFYPAKTIINVSKLEKEVYTEYLLQYLLLQKLAIAAWLAA
jgi:hypothetical protein